MHRFITENLLDKGPNVINSLCANTAIPDSVFLQNRELCAEYQIKLSKHERSREMFEMLASVANEYETVSNLSLWSCVDLKFLESHRRYSRGLFWNNYCARGYCTEEIIKNFWNSLNTGCVSELCGNIFFLKNCSAEYREWIMTRYFQSYLTEVQYGAVFNEYMISYLSVLDIDFAFSQLLKFPEALKKVPLSILENNRHRISDFKCVFSRPDITFDFFRQNIYIERYNNGALERIFLRPQETIEDCYRESPILFRNYFLKSSRLLDENFLHALIRFRSDFWPDLIASGNYTPFVLKSWEQIPQEYLVLCDFSDQVFLDKMLENGELNAALLLKNPTFPLVLLEKLAPELIDVCTPEKLKERMKTDGRETLRSFVLRNLERIPDPCGYLAIGILEFEDVHGRFPLDKSLVFQRQDIPEIERFVENYFDLSNPHQLNLFTRDGRFPISFFEKHLSNCDQLSWNFLAQNNFSTQRKLELQETFYSLHQGSSNELVVSAMAILDHEIWPFIE